MSAGVVPGVVVNIGPLPNGRATRFFFHPTIISDKSVDASSDDSQRRRSRFSSLL